MASFGFRVRGSHGVTQVDQDHANFVMTAKGTATMALDGAWSVLPVVSCTITVSGRTPILATSCALAVTVQSVTNSGSTWTFYVTARASSGGQAVNWWVFDDADFAPPADDFGVRVNRPDGSLAWHSTQKVARIVDLLTTTGAHTFTSGPVYAVAQVKKSFSFTSVDIGSTWRNRSTWVGASIDSNVVSISSVLYEQYTTPDDQTTYESLGFAYLIIDVSNY